MWCLLITTPTPKDNSSYGIKEGVHMPYFGSVCHIFGRNPLISDPHCMAHFGGIFFANMGRGGWSELL